VTTSSTSITIKWANSKLAEMLRKREEEEALLRGNRVRHKEERSDDGKQVRRTKWKANATGKCGPVPLCLVSTGQGS